MNFYIFYKGFGDIEDEICFDKLVSSKSLTSDDLKFLVKREFILSSFKSLKDCDLLPLVKEQVVFNDSISVSNVLI